MHTLPLITRPTEHSGVTFGAATSVLLTGVEETFAVRRYKNGGRTRRNVETLTEELTCQPLCHKGFRPTGLITRPAEHSGVTFGAATRRSTNWCGGDLSTTALQKGV